MANDDPIEDDDDAAFELSPEQCAELDRRWKEYLADPSSAIPWEVVRRRLRDGL